MHAHLPSFKQYRLDEGKILFSEYVQVIDLATDQRVDEDLAAASYYISGKLANLVDKVRGDIAKIVKMTKISAKMIGRALKERSVYKLIKAFNFSITAMFEAVSEGAELVRFGLFDVIQDIEQTNVVQKIERGVLKYDEFIQQYPILNRLSSKVVAALLVFTWLNMSFLGKFDYDMNMSNVAKALRGTYDFKDLLVSREGKVMLSLLGTGPVISFPWLGSSTTNLTIAIAFTGFMLLKETKQAQQLKQMIKQKVYA